jgi:hypothetical protein
MSGGPGDIGALCVGADADTPYKNIVPYSDSTASHDTTTDNCNVTRVTYSSPIANPNSQYYESAISCDYHNFADDNEYILCNNYWCRNVGAGDGNNHYLNKTKLVFLLLLL